MNLVIHDLDPEEWSQIAKEYDGWEVVSDDGTIRPCVGCFGCWVKTPGVCVIRDGYEKNAARIHKAAEVVVISRYTYGGFSSFIKNVFDRSIGWVLPYFEVYEGEMHHKKRYPETKPYTFIFRGENLGEEEKTKARRYVQAVCRNMRAEVKAVKFEECASNKKEAPQAGPKAGYEKTVLLNCSQRGDKANTRKILDRLLADIEGEKEILNLSAYNGKQEELLGILLAAKTIVLGMPLYVDGIPSSPLRLMEALEQLSKTGQTGEKKIYVISQMGMFESRQIENLLGMVKSWCQKCGYVYAGGVALGAGVMMSIMIGKAQEGKGPAGKAAGAVAKLSASINTDTVFEDIYADAVKFPRFLYILIGNSIWPPGARENGLKKKDLLRRIEE